MIRTPYPSLEYLLDTLIAALTPYVHLYVVDLTITDLTTRADLTECSVPGYAPQLARTWSPSAISGTLARTYADPVVFVRTGLGPPQQVYGYYLTDGLTGPLLWVERGPAVPYPLVSVGDSVRVRPAYQLGDCGSSHPGAILSVGDLVGDGSSRAAAAAEASVGDLVGDGSSRAAAAAEASVGDLVGDGITTVGPAYGVSVGDLVGDGSSRAAAAAESSIGDLVGDGSSTGSVGIPAGLLVRLEADQGTWQDTARTFPATVTGQRVQGWTDLSGLGHHVTQATTLLAPTLVTGVQNGLPGVRFVGLGEYLTWSTLTAPAGGYSLFAVLSCPVSAGAGQYLIDSQTGRLIFAVRSGQPTFVRVGWYDGSWRDIALGATGVQQLEWHLTAGSTGEVDRNGVSLGTAAYTSCAIGGQVALCAAYDGTGGYLAADVSALWLFQPVLSAGDITLVRNALRTKWAAY